MSGNLLSCKLGDAKPDWKAYALGEMTAGARQKAEAHAAECDGCHEEWSGLNDTLAALSGLREEELPRRIAFVSDKVFEQHWWQLGWPLGSQAFLRPAFLGTSLLAGAILIHAFVRPVGVVAPKDEALRAQITQQVTAEVTRDIEKQVHLQVAQAVDTTVDAAVTKAVADTRQADDRRTAALLAAAESRYQETAELLNKQVTRIYAMNSGAGVR